MKVVELGEIAQINPRPPRIPDDAEVSFVGMAELDSTLAHTDGDVIRKFADVSKGYTVFEDGDVLVAKITPCFENNKIGQARLQRTTGVGSTEFHVIRCGEHLDDRYLLHFLRQERVRRQGELRMTGSAGQRRVPVAFLRELKIPLPPLDEQRRIAAILDQADAIRTRRRRVLSHLDTIARSIFLDLFGDFSGKHLTVQEVAAPIKGSIRTGPFGSQLLHGEFVSEGIAVLGLDNVVGNQFSWKERRFITPEKYDQLRRYTVLPGDVLVSIMGTCGRCVVVPPDVGAAINTKHICAITVDHKMVLPEFVRGAFLWHPRSRHHLTQRTKGSIMDGLNMGIIKEMPLPVPELEDQREFVAAMDRVNALSQTALRSSAQLDELFASLQSQAFAGQL